MCLWIFVLHLLKILFILLKLKPHALIILTKSLTPALSLIHSVFYFLLFIVFVIWLFASLVDLWTGRFGLVWLFLLLLLLFMWVL